MTRWNEGGPGKLTPNFGGGRPSKLDETEQQQLLEHLREGQPWKKQEIQHLLDEELEVEYYPNYPLTVLDELVLHYAIPRTKRPDRPENTKEILDERVEHVFDEDAHDDPHNKREDEKKTKGGTLTIIFALTAAV